MYVLQADLKHLLRVLKDCKKFEGNVSLIFADLYARRNISTYLEIIFLYFHSATLRDATMTCGHSLQPKIKGSINTPSADLISRNSFARPEELINDRFRSNT